MERSFSECFWLHVYHGNTHRIASSGCPLSSCLHSRSSITRVSGVTLVTCCLDVEELSDSYGYDQAAFENTRQMHWLRLRSIQADRWQL